MLLQGYFYNMDMRAFPSKTPGSLLITAAISAALCALFLGVADLVARKGACREEPLLRARALSHLFALGLISKIFNLR